MAITTRIAALSTTAAFLTLVLPMATAAPAPLVKNAGFEAGTLESWRTHMPPPFFAVTRERSRSGKHSLRGQGDASHRYNAFAFVAQPLRITPIPGASYRISAQAWARLAPGKKRVQIAVREVDVAGKTIRYSGPHVKANEPDWHHYTHTFRASDGVATFQVYLVLSQLEATDVVYFDDISVESLTPVSTPITARAQPFDPARAAESAAETLELSSREMRAEVDADSGLLRRLTLTAPKPKDLHPPARLVTCVFCQRGARETRFAAPHGKPRRRTSRDGQTIETVLGSDDDDLPLRATVAYRMTSDSFEERVVMEAEGDVADLCRLGVRHGFVPEQWRTIVCALRPVRAIAADQATSFCYNEREGDLHRGSLDTWQSVTYPLTVLEGDDCFVAIGDLSADAFVTVAPNAPKGYFPSVQQNPTRIRKGDRFEFSLTYKVLPKHKFLLRDAWRWYAARFRSTHPLLRDLLPYEPPYPPRTLPVGCHATASGHYTKRGLEIDTRRTLPGSNIWYFAWHDSIRERYPTKGTWWADIAGWQRASAEVFKAELARYRAQGFKSYLYFRQIANLNRRGKDLPSAWVKARAGGGLALYGGGYFRSLPKHVADDVGASEIRWGTYNFDNDEFRGQYLQQVRSCLSYYQPAGVAWDMGWWPGHPGIVAVQAAAYGWMKENHPDMRVISNEASGTPSQFFADAILIENGIAYGKSWYDYEVSKAFNTYCVTIERPEFFIRLAETIMAGEARWPFAHGLADAKRFVDHLLATAPPADGDSRAKARAVALHANVRAGLRDIGMGSNWGYADMTQLAFKRALPAELVRFMSEIAATPMVTRSYALRLNGRSDRDGDLHVSAWCGKERLRVAAFNDAPAAKPFVLAMDAHVLAEHGWEARAESTPRCYLVATNGTLTHAAPSIESSAEGMILRSQLPAFTLMTASIDAQ